MNKTDNELLEKIVDLHKIKEGSFNIRKNGESIERNSSSDIEIISKPDKSGIDIVVKPGVKNKSVHIPVIVTRGGFSDLVYNDFYIGENSDVLIVAGCGIHNDTDSSSSHNGLHTFHLGKNSKVRYVEKHIGLGNGKGNKILNPVTNIVMKESSYFEMETDQIEGVSFSNRITNAKLYKDAKLVIKEKILTTDCQEAHTRFKISLIGENSSVKVVSRSVAKDSSKQTFYSKLIGKNECFGHVECDGIILGRATIDSTPKISAKCVDASLIHEAAIGKIAGEQLTKLMTLGLSQSEAEETIIKGFLS